MGETAAAGLGRDARVVGLISTAHFFSHFFQLVLPPLFPVLKEALQVSYADLGLLMTLFYLSSGLAQTPAGFLVDRFGARRVLLLGLGLLAAATFTFGLAPGYWALLPLVVVSGIGNSVFHPADYSILTARVSTARMGRAYSIHTIGGNLGWAAAPVFMLAVATLFDWRVALMMAGGIGLLVTAYLATQRRILEVEPVPASAVQSGARREGTSEGAAPLFSQAVVLCFVYFLFLSVAMIGTQSFLPTTLLALHQTPLTVGNGALTAFLLMGSAGILAGGLVADRTTRHHLIVAGGLTLAAALFLVIGAVELATTVLIGVVGLAGFLMGSTMPSRDMLVRAASPEGATGRVFGFVYSGLDAGAAVGPFVIGLLLDGGRPAMAFWFVAAVLACAVLAAMAVRGRRRTTLQPAE